MNIIKPQKMNLEKFQEIKLVDIRNDEEIEYANIENEECNNILLQDTEFEHCRFNSIVMQDAELDKITFSDVIFKNCDFSNTSFINSTFIRCEFINCKLSGTSFSENRLFNVTFFEANANYINLSMASLEKVLFKNMQMRTCYFQETKMKDIFFEDVDLTRSSIF